MPSTRSKGGFYAVNKGKEIGVFYTWSECEERVKGYPGAKYKKFNTREDAEAFAYGTSRTPSASMSCSLPSGSRSTRLEHIIAALSSMPASQPSSGSTMPSTQKSSCSQTQCRDPQSSAKRLQEIYLALTTSPSSSEPFATQATTSSQSSISSSPSSSQEESFMTSTPSTSPPPPTPKYKAPATKLSPRVGSSLSSTPRVTSPPPIRKGRSVSTDLRLAESTPLAVESPPPPSQPQFRDDGPLSQYFSQRPSFSPKLEESSPLNEFNRMCKENGLKDKKRKDAYEDLKVAMTQEFNTVYGTDVDSLESWQALCFRIGILPIPDTLDECREVVINTHVNIVDLLSRTGKVKIFRSVVELSDYTRINKKIFPQEEAYAGPLLKYLLRHIFEPERDAGKRTWKEYEGIAHRGQNLTRTGRIYHGRRPY